MFIARQKRKENIAEYLLYMWQVEDLLRACKLDIDIVDAKIIAGFGLDDDRHREAHAWYESLIDMMRREHKKEHGHLQINDNVIIKLNDLHAQLLHDATRFPKYGAEYYKTLPFIVELRARTPEDGQRGEIETCFNALYGTLLLKLQGKTMTAATQKAIEQISHFIGLLAAYFKKDEEQPLFDND